MAQGHLALANARMLRRAKATEDFYLSGKESVRPTDVFFTRRVLVWSLCHNSPQQALLWPRVLRRKDKDLPGINQVGIADLLPVRLVDDGVARARAVGEAANAP